MLHSDRDSSSFELVSLVPLVNSERGQAEGVVGCNGFVRGRPITNVVPTVQPKGGRDQKPGPPDGLKLTPHMARRELA